MSKASELLGNLTEEEIANLSGIGSLEAHIVIGRDRYIVVPIGLRRIAVQGDNDVETVTFDCPRYWDDNDLSEMTIYINYMLSNGYKDRYPVDNVRVDEDVIHFDWTISRNVTQVSGRVSFLICANRSDGTREWHSEINQEMYVSDSIECDENEIIDDPDLVTELLQRMAYIEENGMPPMDETRLLPRPVNNIDNYKLIRVNSTGDGWELVPIQEDTYIKTQVVPYLLSHAVTDNEDGKVMMVKDGSWQLMSVPRDPHKPTVKAYGAQGDGVTDDTEAIRRALASERVLYIPGGTYRLTGPLVIRENCELELAQDVVLQFEQTSGNAITLLRLATLRGNHATIFVPYTFNGNVVNADTGDDQAALGALSGDDLKNANSLAVPPFRKWCPQWKMSRYVTDINICKRTSDGFHQSSDGTCYGTAVNLHCDIDDITSFMWGVNMSGLRIAGGFKVGIHAHNIGDHMASWNHDMRIEAVIDACEIAVLIDNCYYSRFNVTIQAREARDGTVYAKHGIKIMNSQGIDLTSSRVWDWENVDDNGNAVKSLWTNGGEYQHIAMIGDCRGLLLDDFLCHKVNDIREHIYADPASNFDTMVVLQEPGNKWFKSKDGEPYFYDGVGETKLLSKSELDAYFSVDTIKTFEDALAAATDTDGSVYNDIGYKRGVRFNSLGDGVVIKESNMYMTTGFIPCVPGQTIYGVDLKFNPVTNYGYAGIVFYNGSKSRVSNMAIGTLVNGDGSIIVKGSYTETSDGFSVQVANSQTMINYGVKYIRIVFPLPGVGASPMISIDDPIKYKAEGFLSDGINVKGDSIVLTSAGGKAYSLAVSDTGALTAVPIE